VVVQPTRRLFTLVRREQTTGRRWNDDALDRTLEQLAAGDDLTRSR
jgi:hypothetical protein